MDMHFENIPIENMIGMGFAVLLAIGLPVFLMFFVKFRKKARLNFFFIGAAIFVFSALMLEQICHLLVLGLTNGEIRNSIVFSSLYGGIAAAVFEESGRLIAMKFFMSRKKIKMDNANAFMYGIGHGGAESILIIGLTNISNLTTSVMVNSGAFSTQLKGLNEVTRKQMVEHINQIAQTPSYQFYLAGIERIFTIILQIALTILVYQGVKHAKKHLVLLAYAGHFMVDFVITLANNMMNAVAAECLLASFTAAVAGCAYMTWQKYECDNQTQNG